MAQDRLPPLLALRVFDSAARHLSFTKAADELFVTPGAVSQQIRLLEEHLGVELFVRNGRRVALSDAGRAGVAHLRAGFDSLHEAVRAMRQAQRRGRVMVSVAPSFAAKWLMPRLFRFNEIHPDIDVWVSADPSQIDFAVADVDLAIRFGPGGYAGLHEERLMGEGLALVAAPALMEAAPIASAEDVRHHTLLHDLSAERDPAAPDWAMWLKAHQVAGADPNRGPRFSQASLVLEAAIAGRGVALARHAIAAADLAAGRLVTPLGLEAEGRMSFAYHLVWPDGRALTPAQSTFANWLRHEAAGGEDGPGGDVKPPVFAGQAI
jgi:LysR family transcriptional regulator, glycine cleavage system transcriptional activator